MSEQDLDAIFDEVVGDATPEPEAETSAELGDEIDELWDSIHQPVDSNDVVTDVELEEFQDVDEDIEIANPEAEPVVDEVEPEEVQSVEVDPATLIKAYDKDGNEMLLSEDTVIETKVDGEIVKIPLKEYRSDLSGQRALAQRFSALDAEKKMVEQRKQAFDNIEQNIHGMMQNGQVWQAFDYIFGSLGYTGDQVIGQFFDQISEPLQKYANLTPDEQRLWAANAQAERHRLELDKMNQERNALQARAEQEQEVRRVQQLVGLDNATFAQRYEELVEDMQSGRLRQQDITAELVGHYHIIVERTEWVQEALQAVRPDLAGDEYAVQDILRTISRNFDAAHKPVGKEDIDNLIHTAYGDPALKKKSEEVKQALEKKGNPVANKISSTKSAKTLREPKHKHNFMDAMADMSDKELAKAMQKWAK